MTRCSSVMLAAARPAATPRRTATPWSFTIATRERAGSGSWSRSAGRATPQIHHLQAIRKLVPLALLHLWRELHPNGPEQLTLPLTAKAEC